jgi:hypothetical protein
MATARSEFTPSNAPTTNGHRTQHTRHSAPHSAHRTQHTAPSTRHSLQWSYPVLPGRTIERVTVVWFVLAFAAGAAVTWVLVRQQAAARLAALEVKLQASDERHTILSNAEQALRDAFRSMASEA